jgi:tRNA A-37 threonylcarbamoyl transferase component Bud32
VLFREEGSNPALYQFLERVRGAAKGSRLHYFPHLTYNTPQDDALRAIIGKRQMTETPAPIPEKISRYEILREIGRGGMATVYLANDPNFGREVAIKILPHELMHDPSFRARFQREARTIATLEHPAIVPVYDFGEENGQPFLVMRYLSGGSLVARIRAGPMPAEEAARILARIGSALDAAHAKGIVHRDLKPANILFDQYGEAYLGDFGIAQLSGGSSTLTGSMILGTPAYMSPEQISGEKKVDGRSDIYALGIVVYEMLTGQTPFQADSPVKMMMMHVSTPLPPITKIDARIPAGSSAVLERALAKEPEQRYQKAADFSRAFDEITTQRNPRPAVPPAGAIDPTAATGDFPQTDSRLQQNQPASPAGRGKGRRWTPLAIAASLAVCLCLGGGGGAVLLSSDFGKWLLAAPLESTPTAEPTAAPTGITLPTDAPAPSVEAPTPSPSAVPYVAGEPFQLTNGLGVSSKPRIAMDSKGVVHAFWMDKTDELDGQIFHRALSGGIWSEAECVSCQAGKVEYLYEYEFTARANGSVCAAFQWTPEYRYVVSTACYLGEGPAEIQELEFPGDEIEFLMDMDPSGNLITVFRTTKSIQFGGQSVSDNSILMYAPAFAIDSRGGYHLAWVRDSEPPVLVSRFSTNQGATWSAPQVLIKENINISSELILFAGSDGEMHLLISDNPVRTLRWKGTWSAVTLLSEDFIPYDFSYVSGKNGKLMLLGTGYYSGYRGIWSSDFNTEKGVWTTPLLMRSLDTLMINGFSATAGSNGRILLAYGQNSDDVLNGEIWFLEASAH